jgi:hypothetical protein
MTKNVLKKTEKKSLKKPQSKPYIVTHWHTTLNRKIIGKKNSVKKKIFV